jgi:hypothetical protein
MLQKAETRLLSLATACVVYAPEQDDNFLCPAERIRSRFPDPRSLLDLTFLPYQQFHRAVLPRTLSIQKSSFAPADEALTTQLPPHDDCKALRTAELWLGKAAVPGVVATASLL